MTQTDLLSWRPSPPAEPSPTPEKFRRAKGEPRDYAREWAAFVEAHPIVADELFNKCLTALILGVPRIEVNALFAWMRAEHKITANNSWRAACADWLVGREPGLAAKIERRKRKVTK